MVCAGALTILLAACTKQLPRQEISCTVSPSAAIIEGYMAPPVLLKAYVVEAPPTRPQQLVDYVFTQRAYQHLTGSGNRSAYYTQRLPTSSTPYGGGATNGMAPTILVDFETGYALPAVDLTAMVNCFNSVRDADAVCTVEILVDIPVDGEPKAFFNWSTNSPGHCFLRLRKTGGGRTVSGSIGFYPESALKASATTAPIPGKFVENSGHEYNASMHMAVTPAEFRRALGLIQLTAKAAKYDVDDYNCTDFALQIFNALRPTDPILPMRQRIPNTLTTTGSMTPQGLYAELLRRKASGTIEKFYIRNSTGKVYCPPAENPCQ